MKNAIIRIITNIMATTGLAAVVLSLIVRIRLHPSYDLYFSYAVLQIFGANIAIHLGLLLTQKFDSKYLVLEVLLDMAYISAVVTAFGLAFDWFVATPILILVAMAAVIHLSAIFLNMARIREDANIINKLLEKRDGNKRVIDSKGQINFP